MTRFAAALLLAGAATSASAQIQVAESRCADCHFANFGARSIDGAAFHLQEWDSSPHGRANVGCERCHGGDPTTFDAFLAHRDVLGPRNPASPIAPTNLPATCGSCHAGPYAAFQTSRHYALLQQGDQRAPVCTLCHGTVSANLPSGRALESRCEHCHGPKGDRPMPDATAQARALLDGVHEVRSLLDQSASLIRRLEPGARRERLLADWRQADVPLATCVSAGHAFVFEGAEEQLATARQRAQALLDDLVRPAP